MVHKIKKEIESIKMELVHEGYLDGWRIKRLKDRLIELEKKLNE